MPTIEEKIVTIEKLIKEIIEVEVNMDRIVEQEKLVSRTNI